jgi:hypothetical protein
MQFPVKVETSFAKSHRNPGRKITGSLRLGFRVEGVVSMAAGVRAGTEVAAVVSGFEVVMSLVVELVSRFLTPLAPDRLALEGTGVAVVDSP